MSFVRLSLFHFSFVSSLYASKSQQRHADIIVTILGKMASHIAEEIHIRHLNFASVVMQQLLPKTFATVIQIHLTFINAKGGSIILLLLRLQSDLRCCLSAFSMELGKLKTTKLREAVRGFEASAVALGNDCSSRLLCLLLSGQWRPTIMIQYKMFQLLLVF